jgi:hypothetical protein
MEEQVVDQSQQLESSSQPSPEGNPAAEAVVETNLPAVQPAAEKPSLEKLREKGSVDRSAIDKPAAAAAVAAYKANFKFKAAGKEMEVPEMLRGVIKDADSEKYLHTLLSKAHGIEMIQDKLRGTRAERDEVRQAYTKVMEPINYGREAYGRGDLDTVFNVLAIDPNKVLQWAVKKVQLSQMPADQRQIHEANEQAQRRNWELERQTADLARGNLDSQANQISQMMDLVLERPDINAVAQSYDTKRGKEGSFRDLMAMMGDREFHNNGGKIISPLEAAKLAVELIGEKFGAQAQPAPAALAPAAQPAAATTQEKAKITLPNAGGSKSAAPAKAKVKSLDDLRRIHKEMQG